LSRNKVQWILKQRTKEVYNKKFEGTITHADFGPINGQPSGALGYAYVDCLLITQISSKYKTRREKITKQHKKYGK
jgi:hypothetical protein